MVRSFFIDFIFTIKQRYLLFISINMSKFIGLAALGLSIFGLKEYYGGAQCFVTRDLTGKVAIITGGNTGIGKETAIGLAQKGCEVIIAARDV
jgi:hypothetical protein